METHEHESFPDTYSSSHQGLHGGTSELLLFQGLAVTSVGAFVFACFCLAVIAFLLEMARHYASKYEGKMRMMHEEKLNLITATFENSHVENVDRNSVDRDDSKIEVSPEASSSMNDPETVVKTKFSSGLKSWFILGFLYISTYLVTTFLMLIAMTYNIYLILSLCFGITTGKLVSLHLKYRIPQI